MIVNGKSLLALQPVHPMHPSKIKSHGVSHGLSEAGYDLTLKQTITYFPATKRFKWFHWVPVPPKLLVDDQLIEGNFTIASAVEKFQMPSNLVGIVHDKSTWARKGLSVFNTVIEPAWHGYLTLELVFHGSEEFTIHAGSGIAQVIFHQTTDDMTYNGKYQGQGDRPIGAILEKG